ncbi:MAG: tcrY [Pseudonocardiales bacterium]|nr:tcrY [Pseudonocardiales bacterium]
MTDGVRANVTKQRPNPAGLRRLWAARPLRIKLVVTVVLLVMLALGGSGAVGIATLRAYLTGRVDSQLRSVATHPGNDAPVAGTDTDQGGAGGGNRDSGGGHRLPSAFVVAVTDTAGAITYGPTSDLIDPTEPLPQLPHLTASQSAAQGSHILTVRAVSGNEQWRVLVEPVTLTDGTKGTLLVAQSLGDVRGTVDRLTALLAVIGGVAVLLVAAIGYLIVRVSLRPLRQVEHTAAAIAAGDLTQRVARADPGTEVGQLAAALNTMLSEIETAFAHRAASEAAARNSEAQMRVSEGAARESEHRMRRFIADASHELRTPLTSIRGFSELYRQGAAASDADVRRLMARIEDEAKRMGLLVVDLLMLARLDQQRPLDLRPVDLLAVAADAVHDAQTVNPSRTIRLEVGGTDPPPIVTGDEPRLRQVLGNLMANAVQHTPDGTPVTVAITVATAGGHDAPVVVLSVTDEGPGLTPLDAERIFERFYRTDQSRSRDDGGSGLGLSIVAALVAGHGGRISVETAPGSGARFRVELPLADAPAVSVAD